MPLIIAVNLSVKANSIASPITAVDRGTVLQKTGLLRKCLEREVTRKHVLWTGGCQAVTPCFATKSLGVMLSIDDLATRLSSLFLSNALPNRQD